MSYVEYYQCLLFHKKVLLAINNVAFISSKIPFQFRCCVNAFFLQTQIFLVKFLIDKGIKPPT